MGYIFPFPGYGTQTRNVHTTCSQRLRVRSQFSPNSEFAAFNWRRKGGYRRLGPLGHRNLSPPAAAAPGAGPVRSRDTPGGFRARMGSDSAGKDLPRDRRNLGELEQGDAFHPRPEVPRTRPSVVSLHRGRAPEARAVLCTACCGPSCVTCLATSCPSCGFGS